MTRTVADRMVESAGRGWVGREREIDALLAAATADEPPFLVAFVHGPGGIGKTHLVRRLLDALPAPVRGAYLDGRDVEPTRAACAGPSGRRSAGRTADPDLGALARALAARPTVLVIDTYEALGLLDAWLRTQFLPALPATTLTVLAGRDRPATAWHTTAGWQGLVAEFPLAALSADEADQLLRRRGLDERQARWAGEFAHGHPLALELAAAAVRADPRCTEARAVAPDGLLEAFLGQLPPATVTLVEAASTVRRITEPLLAAMLETPSARAAFDVLRALPFTEQTDDGLLLHDVVRDTVGNDLAMRDPDRRRAYRRRAVTAPHRAPARYDRGPVAAHGRPHVPHREPGAPRRVLPQRPACLLGRARHAARPGRRLRHRRAARVADRRCVARPLVGAPCRDVLGGPRAPTARWPRSSRSPSSTSSTQRLPPTIR